MSDSSRRRAVAAILLLSLTATAGCSFSGSVGAAGDTRDPTPAPATSSAASPSSPASPSTQDPPVSQAPPSTSPTAEGTTSIRFPSNTDTSTVTGTSPQGEQNTYTFDASAGQTVEVAITSTDDTVNFSLTGPDGTPLKTMSSETREATYPLSTSGTYVIALASPRAGVDYSLELTIPQA